MNTHKDKGVKKECKTCYGFGLWGIGEPSPMGPMDAGKKGYGMPTIPCPECKADWNPSKT